MTPATIRFVGGLDQARVLEDAPGPAASIAGLGSFCYRYAHPGEL